MKLLEADTQHYGLLREALRVIFGLSTITIDKVVRIVKSSKDVQNARTQFVRKRAGVRAMKYLRNSIEYARTEGIEKHVHGTEEEPDESKKDDLEHIPTSTKGETKKNTSNKNKNEVKESFLSFKDFLLTELDARMTARLSTSDQMTRRENAMKSNQEMRKETENKIHNMETSNDPDEIRLANLIKQEAMLRKRIQDKKEMAKKRG